MPSIETDCLFGKALLWPASGFDEFGEQKIGARVELDVRWENEKRDTLDSQGNTIAVDATVVVDRDVPVGSVMWQGGVDDLVGTATEPDTDLHYVAQFTKIPDIKQRVYRRLCYLVRLSNEMPSGA